MVIGTRRFDGHAAQQRVIQIGRLQPRDISCDLESVLEHRQDAANDGGGHNPVANGEGALQPDHWPIICARGQRVYRANISEGERQNPNGDADAKPGSN